MSKKEFKNVMRSRKVEIVAVKNVVDPETGLKKTKYTIAAPEY